MTRIIPPGTIVNMKGSLWGLRSGSPAIMLKHQDNRVRVLADMGVGNAVRHEVRVSQVPLSLFQPMRLRLAYGVWTEKDGSRVLFSRDYLPLWHISKAGQVDLANPWEWIDFADQQFWWDDADTPWGRPATAERIEAKMRRLHTTGTPRLMNAVDILISGKAESVAGAVRSMMPVGQRPHRHLETAR